MDSENLPIILVDPTGGDLPPTEFPPDEFQDPSQDPTIELEGQE